MRRTATLTLLGLAVAATLALFAALPAEGLSLTLFGERYALTHPRALALIGLAPLFLAVALRTLTDLGAASLWLATAFRVTGFSAAALALTLPVKVEEKERLGVAIAVDVSSSISDEGVEASRELLDDARERAERSSHEIRFAASTFAGTARRLARRSRDGSASIERLEPNDESDLAAALLHAASLLPADGARRVLLVSDGNETRGDAAAAAAHLLELGVEVYAMAAGGEVPLEVALTDLEVPPSVEAGRPFKLRATIHATRTTEARLRVRQGGVPNERAPLTEIELEPGENVVDVPSVAHAEGPLTYRAFVDLDEPDRFPGNQIVEATTIVEGRPRVLVVAEARARTSALAAALSASGHGAEVIPPSAMPTDASAYARFVAVILVNLPASAVSDARQAAVLEATRAKGVTLLVAGGDRAYGLGGWEGTRLAGALPVRLEGEKRKDRPSIALALVMDKSGSMAGAKIELAKEAAKATAELLAPDDQIAVIGFDSKPQRVVRMQAARNRMGIRRDIARLAAGGGTAIFPALDMAYRDLSVTRARVKHVILLTDGKAPEEGIAELTRVMRAEGITVSTIGLGADVQRSFLESVSALGGGRSHFTIDPRHIPRIFMRETTTVSRSAIVEELVPIVPAKRAAFLRGLGLERAPFLRGHVATKLKPSPAELLLATERGEPLLARVRRGEGHVLAWTSDLEPKWAADFIRWPRFSAFLGQLLGAHRRRDPSLERLPMRVERRGEEITVVVDAVGEDDTLLRGLESKVRIHDVSDALVSEARLDETAPGVYEARFRLGGHGAFRALAEHSRDGNRVAVGDARFSHPYPDEWARLGTDDARLEDIARAGGGALVRSLDALFAPTAPTPAPVPIHDRFILVALVSFLVDLLLRRTRFLER